MFEGDLLAFAPRGPYTMNRRTADRIRLLPQFRALRVPWDQPAALLDLAATPMYRWTRPRRLDAIGQSVQTLLGALP